MGLTQTYKLDLKAMMLSLSKILTSSEKQATLQATVTFGDKYHTVNFKRPEDRERGKKTSSSWSPSTSYTGAYSLSL